MKEGLGERGEGKKYLQIKNGVFALRCDKSVQGAVAVEKKDGTVVYEKHYSSLTGYLTGIGLKTHEQYGKSLTLQILAAGQRFQVETFLHSGYATGFLTTLPNADLTKMMLIAPSYSEKDGRKSSTMFIQQMDGQWLKRFWNKENPGDLPELEKKKVKGKDVWDDSARLEFFEAMIPKIDAKLKELFDQTTEEDEEELVEIEGVDDEVKPPF